MSKRLLGFIKVNTALNDCFLLVRAVTLISYSMVGGWGGFVEVVIWILSSLFLGQRNANCRRIREKNKQKNKNISHTCTRSCHEDGYDIFFIYSLSEYASSVPTNVCLFPVHIRLTVNGVKIMTWLTKDGQNDAFVESSLLRGALFASRVCEYVWHLWYFQPWQKHCVLVYGSFDWRSPEIMASRETNQYVGVSQKLKQITLSIPRDLCNYWHLWPSGWFIREQLPWLVLICLVGP